MERLKLLAIATLAGCATVPKDVVVDSKTGLSWDRTVHETRVTFAEADQICAKKGARLPTQLELRELVDDRVVAPTIDAASFPNTPKDWFWTSTPMPRTSRFFLGVSFEYGGYHYLERGKEYFVRCVRDPAPKPLALSLDGVVRSATIAGDLMTLQIARADAAPLPKYEAGQTVLIGVPATVPRASIATEEQTPPAPGSMLRRRYSITSPSNESRYVEFSARIRPNGATSPRLFSLRAGDKVHLSPEYLGAPIDRFLEKYDVVLISTGIGTAHYMSWLRGELDCSRRIILIQGGLDEAGLYYSDELEALDRRCEGFEYVPTLLSPSKSWSGAKETIEALWASRVIAKRWGFEPTPGKTRISICGNPELAENLATILGKEGFKEQIDFEWCEVY
jgi:ferredoxin-NADP reductase